MEFYKAEETCDKHDPYPKADLCVPVNADN